ncbi:PrgI family protein, partial [Oscillospiraceae bacterium OttesenSCG-928-G22]|nr:PrgI family protein [Oscillospiraceae bacterium OttesenSCG-928-G22]
LLRAKANATAATLCMIIVMLPFFMLAMYEKNGQPMEKLVKNFIQVRFMRPKHRPYQTNNFYAVLERQAKLDKEVKSIVYKEKLPRQAHKRREKANRRSHQPGEENG